MHDAHFVADLKTRFNAGEALDFVFFWGHRRSKTGVTTSCFSQWYEAPFVVDGERYATAEHFMMAHKAALFGDESNRVQVLAAHDPGAAKALGRKVQGFDEAIWLEHRFDIVVRGNRAKFAQHSELARFLAHTGSAVLVEASPVDTVWGIGLARDAEHVGNPNHWRGLNLLGFALMQVRDGA